MELKIKKCASSAEAKMKKDKAKKFMLISLGLGAVLSLLAGFIESMTGLLSALGMISALVGVFFIARFILLRNELIRLTNTVCPKCGTAFTLADSTYTVGRINTTSNRSSNGLINKCTITGVDFVCTCSQCGEKHSFHYAFITAEEQTNAFGATIQSRQYSLEDKIADMFSN